MQYAKPGRTAPNVSRVCLGCMGFGDAARGQRSRTPAEAASRRIIRRRWSRASASILN